MTKISTTDDLTKQSRRSGAGPSPSSLILSDSLHPDAEPGRDCPLCPRLVEFRSLNRTQHPDWFNAPVPTFGPRDARLLVIGLAPGLQGANRTGRPFTGDFAGDLLFATLGTYGFARGDYRAQPDDGLTLIDCRVSNGVRCVPPQNKPLPIEINTCRSFLAATIADMPKLRAIVMLGRVSHDTTLKALDVRAREAPFGHGAQFQAGRIRLFDSYHCSRYNTNTGVLTNEMFRSVFASVRAYLDS
ncbi:MAG: uracil-DNA glycosylase [Afipia sp.]|nr:uracil-DNA glycosylase [Afipia sp.]OJW61925.1 MAG: uracil-DNA glycosylase [Afipia sp. 64-13]